MLIGILIIIGIILLDQLTKFGVVHSLVGSSYSELRQVFKLDISRDEQLQVIKNIVKSGENIKIFDWFEFTPTFNIGASFSSFEGATWFFYIVTIFALVLFGYYFKDVDFKNKKFYSIGISVLIGGAIGNFIDRLLLRGVIDFVDMSLFGYEFPFIFNIADVALNAGIVMFIVAVLFYDKD